MSDRRSALAIPQVALIGLFVTALVTAQLTASKVLAFDIPLTIPIPLLDVGLSQLVLPGAALAYALTFFASDCYAELYGRRAAQVVVNVGFAMNLVLLALVWSTISAPAFAGSPVDPATFRQVLGPSTSIVVGSLVAYVVSQNWDVLVFHAIRDRTDGRYLWLRNVGSTATSQAIDTVIFVTLGFVLVPQLLGTGGMSPVAAITLMIGQYILKLLIAVFDTPFVYGVVGLVRSRSDDETVAVGD